MPDTEIFFKWSDDYSVDIPVIDKQHQELVNILNRLFIAVSKREGNKVIAAILDGLMGYTQSHFTLEESLMRDAGYEELEEHIQEHENLIAQLDQLCQKYMVDDKPIYFEMLSFLRGWLKDHILACDKKYSAALQQAGYSTTSWERKAQEKFAAMTAEKKRWWKVWS